MQLISLLGQPLAELRTQILDGRIDAAELLAASRAESTPLDGPFVTCFTPSINRIPDDVVAALGPIGPFAADLALRRIWSIGAQVYQPLALRLSLVGTQYVDLVVRRKYTIEPVAVLVSGSPLAALLRALDQLAFIQRPGLSETLLAEVSKRNVTAGQVQVTEAKQAMVVARPSVYADQSDLAAVRALKARLEPSAIGFRFLEADGEGDALAIRQPPPAWQEASLIRSV